MASFPIIAFIGAGNMGSSLIGGLIHHGHPSDRLWASDPSQEKLSDLHNHYHIHTTTDNTKVVEAADVVIFAIKPQLVAQVAQSLASTIQQHRPLVISIAAGVRVCNIKQWLEAKVTIVRAMPNTPALIGYGATALYTNLETADYHRELAETIMKSVGIVKWLPEEALMDNITALSGSGPAYFFLMMEALENAAVDLGLPHDIAHTFTLQTVKGAAEMAGKMHKSFAELREQVTSKGGTTEKGVAILEEHNIRGLLKMTLQAAKLRSEELALPLGD
jgi:pyrroline-5-carboxylate reductase